MTCYAPVARRPHSDAADENLDHWPYPASLDIYEADRRPVDTGLLDGHGTPIYRLPEQRRIGFRPL
jgi:hypothetical protein